MIIVACNYSFLYRFSSIKLAFSIADQDTQVKLKLANRLYAQKSYKPQQDYLDLVQGSFKADIKLEDFVNNSAAAVQTINAWVEDQTNNLSSKPQLLQQILNDENTRTEELLLYLPKFKMEASFELSDVLKRLGMVNAFSDSAADFTVLYDFEIQNQPIEDLESKTLTLIMMGSSE
ncbi:unnamed protein product [Rotaria socialis]